MFIHPLIAVVTNSLGPQNSSKWEREREKHARLCRYSVVPNCQSGLHHQYQVTPG